MNMLMILNVGLGAQQRHRIQNSNKKKKKILFILQNVNIFHCDIQLLIKHNTIILRQSNNTPQYLAPEFLAAHLLSHPMLLCPQDHRSFWEGAWMTSLQLRFLAMECRTGGLGQGCLCHLILAWDQYYADSSILH